MIPSLNVSSSDACSYPSMPVGWRDAIGRKDAIFACDLVEQTMSPYWLRRQMRFSRPMFLEHWFDFDAMVFEWEHVPSGIIAWSPVDDSHCHLRELHLAESVRGQGKGKEILEAWISYCRLCRFKRVTLKVFAENPARDVYQHVGFDVVGDDENIQGLLKMSRYL